MELAEIARMEQQEQNYWWHVGRRLVLRRVLAAFVKSNGSLNILDIGCGTGINFWWLKGWGRVIGLDSSPEAIDYCRNKHAYDTLVLSDASQLDEIPRLRSGQGFDLITAFDVLEHIQDDTAVLAEWFTGLKERGYLFLTVPAYQWLFSAHDKALHHFRRYSAIELKQKLESAGFRIEFISPFFFFTFPVVVLVRLLTKKQPAQTSYVPTAAGVDTALVGLSRIEAAILVHGGKLPWGSSILVLAQRS